MDTLQMKNFRQYKRATVEFSRDREKMFTILRGSNGTGKTNIMNAITWCLYGKEKHQSSRNSSDPTGLPIVNKESLKETPRNRHINMSVELHLVGEYDIKIKRELTLSNSGRTDIEYDKDVGGPIPTGSTPAVRTYFSWLDPNSGWKVRSEDDFEPSIQLMLPENLSRYFLFDGEKLMNFFKRDQNVKIGIEDISQIEIMERAIKKLGSIKNEKTRKTKNDPQVDLYEKKVDDTTKKIQILNAKIQEFKSIKKQKEKSYDMKNAELEKIGGDTTKVREEEKEVHVERDELKKESIRINSNITEHVLGHAGYVLAHDAINKTLAVIKEKSEVGLLPPDIKDTFLNDLLEKNCCICGSDISKGTPRELVMRQLGNARYTAISSISSKLKFELEPINQTAIKTKLFALEKEREATKINFEKREKRLRYLRRELKGIDENKTKKLVRERTKLWKEIQACAVELKVAQCNKKRKKKKLVRQKQEYNRAAKEAHRHNQISNEKYFCITALEGLENTKKKLIEDVRSEVQRKTKKFFLNFIWKKKSYVDVKINEDYEVAAVDVDGYGVRENLSSGERVMLALAFMAALRGNAGFKFPLVIDTLFGRISGQTRFNTAHALPDALRGEQVILLVTDTEYQAQIQDDEGNQTHPAVHDIIKHRVGKDYDIMFDGKSSEVRQHE